MAESFSGEPLDEVLASIRQVIAGKTPPPRPVVPGEEDVLELGEASADESATEASLLDQPPTEQPAPDQPAPGALLSDISAAASRQALAALSGVTIDPAAPANSLDGMVREMLRPMLKSWLDANLPELVERLVAREIARIGAR